MSLPADEVTGSQEVGPAVDQPSVPLGGPPSPEEVSAAVVWLASSPESALGLAPPLELVVALFPPPPQPARAAAARIAATRNAAARRRGGRAGGPESGIVADGISEGRC